MLRSRASGRDASICAFCQYRLAVRLGPPRHRAFSRTTHLENNDQAPSSGGATSSRDVPRAPLPRRPLMPPGGGGGWSKPTFLSRPGGPVAPTPVNGDGIRSETQNSNTTAPQDDAPSKHEIRARAEIPARPKATAPGTGSINPSIPRHIWNPERQRAIHESIINLPKDSSDGLSPSSKRDLGSTVRKEFQRVSGQGLGSFSVPSLAGSPAHKLPGSSAAGSDLSKIFGSSTVSSSEPKRPGTAQSSPQPTGNTRPTLNTTAPRSSGEWGGMAKIRRPSSEHDPDKAHVQHQSVPWTHATHGSHSTLTNAISRPPIKSNGPVHSPKPLVRIVSSFATEESDTKASTSNDATPKQQAEAPAPEQKGSEADDTNSWGLLARKAAPEKTSSHDFWNIMSENLNDGNASQTTVDADWSKAPDKKIQSKKRPAPKDESFSSTGVELASVLEGQDTSISGLDNSSPAPESGRRVEVFELGSKEEQTSKGRDKGQDGRQIQDPHEEKKIRKDRGKSKRSGRNSRREEDDTYEEEDDLYYEEKRRLIAERKAQKEAERLVPIPIHLPELISITALADALKIKHGVFLEQLGELGFEGVTLDSLMAGETAALVAQEYGFEPIVDVGASRDLKPRPPPADPSLLPPRPPVVTIMGHVDHGKTTLLDYLRKSSVAAQEHGGITQHIGAFSVSMSTGKVITFLDTPGHAAFLTMRERGAQVTDIVVLVVAADDSVMPQTIEALKHARTHKVPIIVAINKIDTDGARIDQVKADLARNGVEIEDFGGDVQVVLVSGKTGQGMEDLEENILTLSEILDMRAELDSPAEGWILESSLKPFFGKTATVLVKRGTLRLGDYVVAGLTWAKIRNMRNEAGVDISEAPPGTPVEILGWRDLPAAGDQVIQGENEDQVKIAVDYREGLREREKDAADQQAIAEARRQHQERRARDKAAIESSGVYAPVGGNWNSRKAAQYKLKAAEALASAAEEADADGTGDQGGEGGSSTKIVNFIVKGDVHGSVEAVCAAIQEIGSHEVRPHIVRSATGPITEFDVEHAAASGSVIVNFATATLGHVRRMAEDQGVKILNYNIIYNLVDDVKEMLNKYLAPEITSSVLGEAEVLQIFPINIKGRQFKNVAGCRVRTGTVTRGALYRVYRNRNKIYDGKLETLKHLKKDVTEMRKGSECGIGFEEFQDLEVGDLIQAYEEIRTERKLQ